MDKRSQESEKYTQASNHAKKLGHAHSADGDNKDTVNDDIEYENSCPMSAQVRVTICKLLTPISIEFSSSVVESQRVGRCIAFIGLDYI